MNFITAFWRSEATCVRVIANGCYTSVGYIPEDLMYILYSGRSGESPTVVKNFEGLSTLSKHLDELGLGECESWEIVRPWT